MWRHEIGLVGGAATGLLVGFAVRDFLPGPILGVMSVLAGAFAGWSVAVCWPRSRADTDQTADYDDKPRPSD
jgi:hypothetical protein